MSKNNLNKDKDVFDEHVDFDLEDDESYFSKVHSLMIT